MLPDAIGPEEIRAALGAAIEAANERAEEVGGVGGVLTEAADRFESLEMAASTVGHIRDAAEQFTAAEAALSSAAEELEAALADFNARDGQVADTVADTGNLASAEVLVGGTAAACTTAPRQPAEVGVYFAASEGADEGPYVAWGRRQDDGTRQVEFGGGADTGVVIDMTPGDLLELHAALAGTLARPDPGRGDGPDDADAFFPQADRRAFVEWRDVGDDGRRRVEAGRGDRSVTFTVDRAQLQQWHDALGLLLAADRAAAADPDDPRERTGQLALLAVAARMPDKPTDARYDTTSKLVLDTDPGWSPQSTGAVERALRLYRCSTFRWINRYLRGAEDAKTSRTMREQPGAEPTTEDVHMHVTLIDTAMQASPLPVPVELWRGWHDTAKALGPLWRDDDMTGVEWTEPRYQSTSADPDVALMFASDDVVMRLHVPAGVGAIQLSGWVSKRHHTREAELLLDRDLRMRIVADQVQEIPVRSIDGTPYTTRVLDVEVSPPPREEEGQPGPPAAAGAAA